MWSQEENCSRSFKNIYTLSFRENVLNNVEDERSGKHVDEGNGKWGARMAAHSIFYYDKTRVMRLNENYKFDIISDILQYEFSKLYELDLCANLISSIESLNWLKMPLIKVIKLSSNQITFVSCLRKIQSTGLSVYLQKNCINQTNSLSEVHNLKGLLLENVKDVACSDIQWLLKFNMENNESIFRTLSLSPQRIIQQNLLKLLKAVGNNVLR